MDEIIETLRESPLENIIFSYTENETVNHFLRGKTSDHCLNLALMVVKNLVAQEVLEEGEDPEELRVSLYRAIDRIFDEVKDNGN